MRNVSCAARSAWVTHRSCASSVVTTATLLIGIPSFRRRHEPAVISLDSDRRGTFRKLRLPGVASAAPNGQIAAGAQPLGRTNCGCLASGGVPGRVCHHRNYQSQGRAGERPAKGSRVLRSAGAKQWRPGAAGPGKATACTIAAPNLTARRSGAKFVLRRERGPATLARSL